MKKYDFIVLVLVLCNFIHNTTEVKLKQSNEMLLYQRELIGDFTKAVIDNPEKIGN